LDKETVADSANLINATAVWLRAALSGEGS
jgi:hypothetical protein